MKVLLLSRYGTLGASSRVRFLQYIPYFNEKDVDISISPLLSDKYLLALYEGNSRWGEIIKGYFSRVVTLFNVRSYDLVIIEKEVFPFIPAIVERLFHFLGVRYIVDYDDAIFHNYDCHSYRWVRILLGKKIDSVMRYASIVTVGNKYIAERAKLAGAKNVELIPTVVDTKRYRIHRDIDINTPIVGWIGTPQTSQYLQPLLPIFAAIKNNVNVRFVAVGGRPEDFEGTAIETWSWSEESEVSSIQQFSIGIMPLKDSPWERGKCGYKLIQYMACGVAVVASPVGVNCDIVDSDKTGKLASSLEEWDQALRDLLEVNSKFISKMGDAGRLKVDKWYSLEVQAPRFLAQIIKANTYNK
ncbi:glycosyltransferase family 4 protein [Psychrobacter cryohalolentis]|uniref:Glycosyl transferase, group 1 n=1 Tax=Psychrobacter cryohalolentis (strain ATCC BAA-1226 / DSM 17306 / VKM B-2378 / K5) TaxID=335284 RepID=Q1QD41_PSYCK|nr:glycosyltransferase family 4 protein [Psychrobacter cryohalolentis]ABE74412.1 glycosyl transferase, group 1 [Psychrobacter cryohalolentis K5]ASE27039.1 glycosyltransferase family 1 protein [Psychrobacter cryohalolentis]